MKFQKSIRVMSVTSYSDFKESRVKEIGSYDY